MFGTDQLMIFDIVNTWKFDAKTILGKCLKTFHIFILECFYYRCDIVQLDFTYSFCESEFSFISVKGLVVRE